MFVRLEELKNKRFHAGCEGNAPQSDGMDAPKDHECSFPFLDLFLLSRDCVIMRVSKCVHYEGNFLYLLLGEEISFLHDTSPVSKDVLPLYNVIQNIIHFVILHSGDSDNEFIVRFDSMVTEGLFFDTTTTYQYPLLVVHSHKHSDHIAGDDGFENKENVTIVPKERKEMMKFYGLSDEEPIVSYNLNGRNIIVILTPGHEKGETDICFYDEKLSIMFTGDILYPGRIYIHSFSQFKSSIQLLRKFTENHNVIAYLGSHIEIGPQDGMYRIEYLTGTRHQPLEHSLYLSKDNLDNLFQCVERMDFDNLLYRLSVDSFILDPIN